MNTKQPLSKTYSIENAKKAFFKERAIAIGYIDGIKYFDRQTKEESEKSWTKYWNDMKKYNLKQLEKFSFFEVCPLFGYSYGTYFDIDFKKHLPKSNKEMIELVKDAIIRGTTSEKGHGRFDDFWWDDEYNPMTKNVALSDYEIITRVKQLVRLYLVPYKREKTVSVDLSFNFNIIDREIDYRFYSNGEEISSIGHHWYSIHLPKYDLYDLEFLSWLREYFNIPQKDMATDEEILEEGVLVALKSMLWHGADKYDVVNKIRGFKDWKQFKADLYSFKKLHHIDRDGGCCGGSVDGFSINFQQNNTRPELTIKQDIKARELSGANTEGLQVNNKYYIVYNLVGDELFKVAFDVLTKGYRPTQTNLFDFMS